MKIGATTDLTPLRAAAEEEDWDTDQGRAQTSLKKHIMPTMRIKANPITSDYHIIGHDPYSGPPEPQPGSYPHGEQLTSRNTM